MKEFFLYFVSLPKAQDGKRIRTNVLIMHFMNRVAILMFLIGVLYLIFR
jgi:hypothetical protein